MNFYIKESDFDIWYNIIFFFKIDLKKSFILVKEELNSFVCNIFCKVIYINDVFNSVGNKIIKIDKEILYVV